MLKRILHIPSILVISQLLALMLGKQVAAGTVLENIARTGEFNVGTSFGIVPYSYFNENDEHVGYSIDIVNLIRDALEEELGRPIALQFVEVNSVAEAFPLLLDGEIDITCNAVFTFARDEHVDFTERYAVSGIRVLTSGENAGTSFDGRRIGIPPAVFAEAAMNLEYPQSTLVPINTIDEAIEALSSGSVDALAGDGVILDGLRQQIDPESYVFIPDRTEPPFARYGVGCMVPENNSGFLNIANKAIITMMDGYIAGEENYTNLVETWFGPDGVVEVQDTDIIKAFFETILLTYEQIPF